MAAAAAWKVRFREVLVEADERCRQLPGMLTAVLQHLDSPVLTRANAVEARARIQLAREAAGSASEELDFVKLLAGHAQLLAVYGAGVVATRPLGSHKELRGKNPAHYNAMEKLLQAKVSAEGASRPVMVCCVHLLVMDLLLDHPRLPPQGVDGFFDAARLQVIDILRDPGMVQAQSCAQLVAGARQDVDGAN